MGTNLLSNSLKKKAILHHSKINLVIFLCFIISFSCGKDEQNNVKEPPITNDQKIILNSITKEPEKQNNISSIDIDSNKLVLNYSNTNIPTYSKGDILIGKTNEGFIRKIENVSRVGNTITITTKNATIEEAFKKFELDTSFTFYPEIQQLGSINERSEVIVGDKKYNLNIKYSTPQVQTKGTLDHLPLSFNNLKFKLESIDKSSKIEIAIEKIDISLKIKADRLKTDIFPFRFCLIYDVTSIVELSNIVEVIKGGIDGTYPINDDLLPKDYLIGIIYIGGIPFHFSINIGLGLQASFMVGVGTEIKGSFKYTDNYKVGAEYSILGWVPVWEKSSSQVVPSFSLSPVEKMTGEAKVYIKPKLKVKLADMIGPSLFVRGYIYDEMSYPPIKVEVGYGLDGGIDFIVNAFGKNIANYQSILASKKWPQYSYTNNEPTRPEVISPIDNAYNIPISTSLSWNCTDSDNDEIFYDVFLSTSNPPKEIVSSRQKEKKYSKTGLTNNTKYYWQIKATDLRGAFSYSPIWSFTTASNKTPSVSTTNPTEISLSSAKVGGNVTNDGGENISDRGIYYSTNILSNGTKHQIGSGSGVFSTTLSGLNPNTTYYVKAYATNSAGTAYGSIVTFKTDITAQPPSVTTSSAINITSSSATLGGNVVLAGSSAVIERGVVLATTQNPTTSNTKFASGSGTGEFSVNATKLITNQRYYVRAYAINSEGVGYGNEVTFTPTGSLTFIKKFNYTDIRSIIQVHDNGYVFAANSTFGGNSVTVVKINPLGETIWERTITDCFVEGERTIIKSQDGGYYLMAIKCATTNDGEHLRFVKIDANGTVIWNKIINEIGRGHSICATSDGGFVVTNEYRSSRLHEGDIGVIKFDSEGNKQWIRSFGGSGLEYGNSIIQTADGGYAVLGRVCSSDEYLSDFSRVGDVIIKINATGEKQWIKVIIGSVEGYSIIADGNNYVITGSTVSNEFGMYYGSGDIYLLKINSSGEKIWSKVYGGQFGEVAMSLVLTTDGGYFLAGTTGGSKESFNIRGNGDNNILALKTDSNGNLNWINTFGIGWALSGIQSMDGGYVITSGSVIKINSNGEL